VNAYRLHQLRLVQLKGKALTHLDFRIRIQLVTRLLEYSTPAKLQYLRLELGGKRLFSPEFQHIHYWIQHPKQAACAWCLYDQQRQRILNKGAIAKERVKRLRGGCIFCNVPLCAKGECWSRYHSNNANY
jgi:hypothetical protein